MSNPIDRTLAAMPYIKKLFGNSDVQDINDKYKIFSDASITKDKQIQRLSITNQYDQHLEFTSQGGMIPNAYYSQMIYGQSSDDKRRRLIEYRVMSQYPEVECALEEICNEVFETDDQGQTITCDLKGDYNDQIKNLIKKEFQKFLHIFKFEERSWLYVWDYLVDGEIFFENIVSAKKPHLGIIGTTRISSERIDPFYYDMDNELIDSYILRIKEPDKYPYQWGKFSHQTAYGNNRQQQILFLNDKQVTYIYNNKWEPDGKKYRLPFIARAQRPYRQLSLIEDATIIYMLVRAPERFVFNIDTGSLPAPKAEQYIKRMMGQFWSKKTIGQDGRVENTYDPISMTENFYFPKSRDGQGSTVESIGGGNASPDNLEILNFFVQKLYKSLKVPLSRLNSDTVFSDGESITREELKFAEEIINMQKQWAACLKKTFIVHLKLRGKKIIENAKKLGIDKIPFKHSNNTAPLDTVFKDNFDSISWDSYDILTDAVNSEIDKRQLELYNINDRLQSIHEQLENVQQIVHEGVLLESLEEIQLLQEQEDLMHKKGEYESEIKELVSNGSSWWDQYNIKEEDLSIEFNKPTQFHTLREQQIFQLKFDNFNNMAQNDMISAVFAMKIYLGWSDEEILTNIELLRKDAALRWELANIEANGPDFREKALEEAQGALNGEELGDLGGLGGGGGSLPAGDTNLPSLGPPLAGEGPGGTDATAPNTNIGNAASGNTPPSAPTGESFYKFIKYYKQPTDPDYKNRVKSFDKLLLNESVRKSLNLLK